MRLFLHAAHQLVLRVFYKSKWIRWRTTMAFSSLSAHADFPDLPEKPFHPDSSFEFPKREFGKTRRSCKMSYFNAWPWLTYCNVAEFSSHNILYILQHFNTKTTLALRGLHILSNTSQSVSNSITLSDDQQQQRRTRRHQTKDKTTSWHQDEGPKTAKTATRHNHTMRKRGDNTAGQHTNMQPVALSPPPWKNFVLEIYVMIIIRPGQHSCTH